MESNDKPDETQVNEVVGELANMICGDTLGALEGSALRLSPPEIVPAADFALLPGAHRRSFDLGNGTLTVAWAFRDGSDE